MEQFGIGQSMRRVEDRRFLTGIGQYMTDIDMTRQLHAYFLRSPHDHALIRRIDTTTARSAPGVALVDALAEWGTSHIDMPATPESIWRAIHDRSA